MLHGIVLYFVLHTTDCCIYNIYVVEWWNNMAFNYRKCSSVLQTILLCMIFGRIDTSPIANVWLSPIRSLTPLKQYHIQDGSGGYHYSFTGPHHAKSESSLNGITQGGKSSQLPSLDAWILHGKFVESRHNDPLHRYTRDIHPDENYICLWIVTVNFDISLHIFFFHFLFSLYCKFERLIFWLCNIINCVFIYFYIVLWFLIFKVLWITRYDVTRVNLLSKWKKKKNSCLILVKMNKNFWTELWVYRYSI